MVNTRMLYVRLTRQQHEQIQHLAGVRGFPHVSAYIRYVALQNDLFIEQKLVQIHNLLTGEAQTKSRRQK